MTHTPSYPTPKIANEGDGLAAVFHGGMVLLEVADCS